MAVSPKRTAELVALSEERPRLKLVCVDGRAVGDAVVIVSPRDPNWYRNHLANGFDGEIRVKRQMARRLWDEIIRTN